MLFTVYTAIFFTIYSKNCIAERCEYLTEDDFSRAKLLPSVITNGTIFDVPHNDNLATKRRVKRNAWRHKNWPNARIPYTLDPNFDDNQRAQVARAFENYHSKTCVRFVPKQSTDNDYVQILRDDTTCGVAEFCRKGGPQIAKFGGSCIGWGVMTHELGHTICFGHEQTRSDRDNFISWDTSKCSIQNKDNANDFTTIELPYDYVSLQHYEGECYNGCIIPKISGVTKCGSGGDLSVLDVEKINAFYNCGGCNSYRFRPISLITQNDNLVAGGVDTSGDTLYPCRGYYNGDIVVGKGNMKYRSCHIGYGGNEYRLDNNFDMLTNPKYVNINWKKRPTDGSFPSNAIRGGRTAEREPLYIGRCTVQFDGKVTTIPGKIHRSASSGLYITYGEKEYNCLDFEILVCD